MLEPDPLTWLFLAVTGADLVLTAAALLLAWRLPQRRSLDRRARTLRRSLCRLARRPVLSCIAVGVVGGGLAAATAAVHWPQPRIHDEFSYLLAADTFASGRLSNPTHPLWEHLETQHVIQRPTHASKYPPAQGLVLAAGQAAFGVPLVGVWVSVGLMCSALCWMLRGFVPPTWATGASLLVALHPLVLGWWGHSYWGGAVAATGGALLFGAAARLGGVRRGQTGNERVAWGVLLGAGVVILASSRPYEGAVVSVCTAVWLAWRTVPRWRTPAAVLRSTGRSVAPAAVVLALGAWALTSYNEAVTGDPLTFPYTVHAETYNAAPVFLWQEPPPTPAYRHEAMRQFYVGYELVVFGDHGSVGEFLAMSLEKLAQLWAAVLGFSLSLSIALSACALVKERRKQDGVRRRRMPAGLFSSVTLLAALGAALLVPFLYPHYLAPVLPLVVLAVVESWRRWRGAVRRRTGERSRALGLLVGVRVLLGALVFIAVPIAASTDPFDAARAEIERALRAAPGEDLVIVRYGERPDPHHEWVYNRADPDSAAIVWAREMGDAGARRLVGHFAGRRVWLLEARMPDGAAAGVREASGLDTRVLQKARVRFGPYPAPRGGAAEER